MKQMRTKYEQSLNELDLYTNTISSRKEFVAKELGAIFSQMALFGAFGMTAVSVRV